MWSWKRTEEQWEACQAQEKSGPGIYGSSWVVRLESTLLFKSSPGTHYWFGAGYYQSRDGCRRAPFILHSLIKTSYAIAEIFNRAIDTKLVQSDIDQLVSVVLARASYERRRLEAGSEGISLMVFTALSSWLGVASRWRYSTDYDRNFGGWNWDGPSRQVFAFCHYSWEGYNTSNSITLHWSQIAPWKISCANCEQSLLSYLSHPMIWRVVWKCRSRW